MAFRLYIVPVAGTATVRYAKYFDGPGRIMPLGATMRDYGNEPWMIVKANLSVGDDATIVSQADVFALPFDLTALLTAGNVTNVTNKLEAMGVPANWVTTALTWQQVLNVVLGMFHFNQIYESKYYEGTGVAAPRLFGGGLTLSTTFGVLPQAVQNAMIAAADSISLDRTGLTSGTTIRAIRKNLADQMLAAPRSFDPWVA